MREAAKRAAMAATPSAAKLVVASAAPAVRRTDLHEQSETKLSYEFTNHPPNTTK